MKTRILFALALFGILLSPAAQAQPVCIGFGPPPPVNTIYGAPLLVNGNLAFSTNGIDAYVYNFALIPAGTAFNRSIIRVAPVSLPGQSLWMTNIDMLFDFRNLPFTVKKVTLSYLDLGGYENLAVNASGIYRGQIAGAPAVIGGTNVSVSSAPTPPPVSGSTGIITLTGPDIDSFQIGGQEFWIDNVCATQ